jgi:hypothetical protein
VLLLLWVLDNVKSTRGHMMVCLGFCGLTLLWTWLANRSKRTVSVSHEERKKPLQTQVDYSNSTDWFSIVSWFVMATLVIVVILPCKRTNMAFADNIVLLGIVTVVMIPFFLAPRRNKYIISGDKLIVQEFDFLRMTTDLTIPFKAIEKVYVSDLFTLAPHVIIVVNGIERKLRCTSHTSELAKSLALRLSA